MPANTGVAGAIYCAACFAGTPAPTWHADHLRTRPNTRTRVGFRMRLVVRTQPPDATNAMLAGCLRTSAHRRAAVGKEAAGSTQP